MVLAATLLIETTLKFQEWDTEKNSRHPNLTKLRLKLREFNLKQKINWAHQPISSLSFVICIRSKRENHKALSRVSSNIKMDTRIFDAIHDIVQCLSLVQSLLKGQNAPI